MTIEVSAFDAMQARFENLLKLQPILRLAIQVEDRESVFYLVVDFNRIPDTALGPGPDRLMQFIRPFLPVEFRSIEPVFDADLKTMTYCLGTVFDILVKTQ